MNEQISNREETVEIDLKRLLDAVLDRAWIVAIASVVCAILTLIGTVFFVTPLYQSSAMFYVNNSSLSVGDASFSISSGDLSTSRNLVESYIVILNTRESLNDVIDYSGVSRGYWELKSMISAKAVNETEIFEVVVTSEDPVEAEKIASGIAFILPKRIASIIEGTSAKVVDAAVVPSQPSSPNYTNNTIIGFLLGFVLSVGFVVLRELFDITIRTEDDIAQISSHPVLAAVPDMTAPTKGGYYYGYGNKKKTKPVTANSQVKLIGEGINFASSEAYKLLRTKLEYSFAGERTCRIIGVSSALTGEGKSLTSVNVAYSLSQLGKRVLLVDCDMRRPSVAAKLQIPKEPGLSGYLSGQHAVENVIQLCGLPEDAAAFHVIAAGKNPPNPVELLSSPRMARLLTQLREMYDYILLDLPPIDEVSDALAVAKQTDGILMVVRRNYCNRIALREALRQFEFVDSHILGINFNCAVEEVTGYGRKYYKRSYRRYYKAAAKEEKG